VVESATLTDLTVQVSRQAVARIEALAAKTGQSTSDLVCEALANYLDYREWKAAAIAEAIAASDAGEEPIEHERMVEWLNSWGTENELPPPQVRVVWNRRARSDIGRLRQYIAETTPQGAALVARRIRDSSAT